MNNQEIVSKLWALCNVLRDDGITYHQYVTELTYILFLKMAKETDTEKEIPEQYRWDKLVKQDGINLKKFYKELLEHPGEECIGRVCEIYAGAKSNIEEPKKEGYLNFDRKYLDFSRSGTIEPARPGALLEGKMKDAFTRLYNAGSFDGALIRCDFFEKDVSYFLKSSDTLLCCAGFSAITSAVPTQVPSSLLLSPLLVGVSSDLEQAVIPIAIKVSKNIFFIIVVKY